MRHRLGRKSSRPMKNIMRTENAANRNGGMDMESLKVLISNKQKEVKIPTGMRLLIRRCCNAVLVLENSEGIAEVSVSFVNNAQIRQLNREYRHKDMPTDGSASRWEKTVSMISTGKLELSSWGILSSLWKRQWSRRRDTAIPFSGR